MTEGPYDGLPQDSNDGLPKEQNDWIYIGYGLLPRLHFPCKEAPVKSYYIRAVYSPKSNVGRLENRGKILKEYDWTPFDLRSQAIFRGL